MRKNFTLWLTGLSASGKTTLAKAIYKELTGEGRKVHHFDGDEVRAASQEKLDFSKKGRDKNIKLAVNLAKEYQDKGFIVVASFISPYRQHRDWGRQKLENFIEIFINAPLEICEARDPKGMYKKARAGKIELFTGIDDPYEKPDNPDIDLLTHKQSIEECAEQTMEYLRLKGFI